MVWETPTSRRGYVPNGNHAWMLRSGLAQGLRVAPEVLDEELREVFVMGRWLAVGI